MPQKIRKKKRKRCNGRFCNATQRPPFLFLLFLLLSSSPFLSYYSLRHMHTFACMHSHSPSEWMGCWDCSPTNKSRRSRKCACTRPNVECPNRFNRKERKKRVRGERPSCISLKLAPWHRYRKKKKKVKKVA